ncbi:unnamed protein product [Ambrosiozyma monospora]|uniref:Unnamed protein product n=1 Tax=Ambrosiozyma monospora TaxID=43982 RepID=A0A9W6T8N2_AMBMO|nr:unnamed protein product [Ambrosiozyma monospora]
MAPETLLPTQKPQLREYTVFTIPIIHKPFTLSALKYVTFFLCGTANLWPWNCFLSASEFFQDAFSSNQTLSNGYSSTMMTVSTISSTVFNVFLSQRQKDANYTRRLQIGNLAQVIIFTLMSLTSVFSTLHTDVGVILYFIFVMFCVVISSFGVCLAQVGVLALVNVEGAIYANANVVGNAVAGVLPSISMIAAVLLNSVEKGDGDSGKVDQLAADKSRKI